jgi:hypothetical protein
MHIAQGSKAPFLENKIVNTHYRNYIEPMDVHAALAHAHADRAAYIRMALVAIPPMLKRLNAWLRPNRDRLPQTGTRA